MNNTAATHWIKYDTKSITGPEINEWCLWSMEIDGIRNYFSGRLSVINNETFLSWDGGRSFPLNDGSIFYARIIRLDERITNHA